MMEKIFFSLTRHIPVGLKTKQPEKSLRKMYVNMLFSRPVRQPLSVWVDSIESFPRSDFRLDLRVKVQSSLPLAYLLDIRFAVFERLAHHRLPKLVR